MIVAIWGNSGCGTSTLAMKLALAIADKNKNVIVVDSNYIAPQAKIWFPKIDFAPEDSMSVILANNIKLDIVASKITTINEHLGILGYGNELSVNTIPNRDDTPSELLTVLNNLADIVIIDCQTNITQDLMSFMALDLAETKIVNMTPDIRGISWYNANVMMLRDKWESQKAQVITAFNKVKNYSPVDAVESAVGTSDFVFPYAQEIEEELYSGKIGEKYFKGTAKKYGLVIGALRDTILEHAESIKDAGVVIKQDNVGPNKTETNANTEVANDFTLGEKE